MGSEHQSQNVYADDSCSQTITAGTHGYGMGYIMEQPKQLGNVVGSGKAQGGRVYDTDNISPAILQGASHGNVMPFIVENKKNE